MSIVSIHHKGLAKFYREDSKSGIQPKHAKKLGRILDRLEQAIELRDLNFPGSDFHPLVGDLKGYYSIHVNGNWVVIFRFSGGDVYDVNLLDYH